MFHKIVQIVSWINFSLTLSCKRKARKLKWPFSIYQNNKLNA